MAAQGIVQTDDFRIGLMHFPTADGAPGQILGTNGAGDVHRVDGGGGSDDHSLLTNLDYASSGHTGFQEALTNPITGTGSVGQVGVFSGTTDLGGDAKLTVDYTLETNTKSALKLESPNEDKFVQMAVDQLWNTASIYTNADNFEIRSNGWNRLKVTSTGLIQAATSGYTALIANNEDLVNKEYVDNGLDGKMDSFAPGNTGSMLYYDGTSRTDTAPILNHGLIYSGSDLRMQASATSYASLGAGGLQISDISGGSASYGQDHLEMFINGDGVATLGWDGTNMLIQMRAFPSSSATATTLYNDDETQFVWNAMTGTTFGTDTGFSFMGIVGDNVAVIQVGDGNNSLCNGLLIGTVGPAPVVFGTNDTEHMRMIGDGKTLLGTPTNIDPDNKAMFQINLPTDNSEYGIYVKGSDYLFQIDTSSGSSTIFGFLYSGDRERDVNLNAEQLEWYSYTSGTVVLFDPTGLTINGAMTLTPTDTAPALPVEGQMYVDNVSGNHLYIYLNTIRNLVI